MDVCALGVWEKPSQVAEISIAEDTSVVSRDWIYYLQVKCISRTQYSSGVRPTARLGDGNGVDLDRIRDYMRVFGDNFLIGSCLRFN